MAITIGNNHLGLMSGGILEFDNADPSNNDLNYWLARQCRNSTEIWSGLVATGLDFRGEESYLFVRREPIESGGFETGDEIGV